MRQKRGKYAYQNTSFFYIQAEITLGNTRPHSDTASNNLDCSFMVYTSSKSKK